jgi:glycosyltransferase involved in cell wall biosynthesis
MKVIHIMNSLNFSGAEIMYVDAAPFFQEKGCILTVMATADELGEFAPYFECAGYKIIHKPMPSKNQHFSKFLYYKSIITLLNVENFDVIHIHKSSAMWWFSLCAWLTNTKSVYTFHSVFPTRFFTYYYHLFLRLSAKFIFKCKFQTISDTVYDHEVKLYNNTSTKIYNWYGTKRYFQATTNEKNNVRISLGIDVNALVVISVGGCSLGKRHSEILKALPYVIEKIPNTIYVHLGKGEAEHSEKKVVEKLDLANNVMFCGNQHDVRKYLIASDIYLMTSQYEGISITTIEAMACNIPSILYDVPGLREFNKEGENCLLIPENHQVLADSIIKLNYNKTETHMMAIRAKKFVNKKFNLETNAYKIYEMYL